MQFIKLNFLYSDEPNESNEQYDNGNGWWPGEPNERYERNVPADEWNKPDEWYESNERYGTHESDGQNARNG